MKQKSWILAYLLWSACGNAQAQTNQVSQTAVLAQSRMAVPQRGAGDKDAGTLDAKREKHAAQVFLTLVEKVIVAAADAMPADTYGFAPTDGEFKGVTDPRWCRTTSVRSNALLPGRCKTFSHSLT